jgi:TPR repeat protein
MFDVRVVGRSCMRPLLRLAMALTVGTVALLAGDPETGGWTSLAWAQQGLVSIKVAPVTRAEAASRLPLQIQVGPQDALAKNSFIRIRGLPATVALSEGHAIAPGAWAVPLAALPGLGLILPAGVEGPSEVAISLVSVEGAVLAEAKTTLVVAPARARAASPEPPPSSVAPVVVAPKLSPAERERALGLHTMGLEQLQRGNVFAARKFFERAAEAGLAQGAVAAAGTYDPDELAKLSVVGLQPDVEAARKWYERARELGAVEAGERLRRLGSR